MNLRASKKSRKDKCSDINHDMQKLAGRDFRPINSPCFEYVENSNETLTMDKILSQILIQDLPGAYDILINASNRERLYPMEMVYILLVIKQMQIQACVVLWEDDWGYTPFQKYQILTTYLAAIRANLNPELSVEAAASHPVFDAIRNYEKRKDIISRILLSVGNISVAAELSKVDKSFAEIVAKCQARKPEIREEPKVQLSQTPIINKPIEQSLPAQTRVVYKPIEQVVASVVQPTTEYVPVLVPKESIKVQQPVITAPAVQIPVQQTEPQKLEPHLPPAELPKPPVQPVPATLPLPDSKLVPPPSQQVTEPTPKPFPPKEATVSQPAEIVCHCPLQDRRYIIETMKTLSRGLKYLQESGRVSTEERTNIEQFIPHLEAMEAKIRPSG